MSIIRINTAFNIELEFEVAAFHKRLLAYLIDLSILVGYMVSMKYLLYDVFLIDNFDNVGIDILLISLPMLLYSLISEVNMNGQTLGKKLMSIRVISMDGGEPSFGQYLIRWITKFFEWPFLFGYMVYTEQALYVYILRTCFLGIVVAVIILITSKRQRLGDLAAGTVIVESKSAMSVEDTVFMDVNNENYTVTYPEVMRLSDNDINTIKTVITQARKRNNDDMSFRVEAKVKQVLGIESRLSPNDFLEKLLEDYNYLATRE